jgi:S-adenosylmethionine:tRNA ribosyltransferase-isomerase
VPRAEGGLVDTHVFALPHYLRDGDVLVVNATKVIPAALTLKTAQGEPVFLCLIPPSPGSSDNWQALGRPQKHLKPSTTLFSQSGQAVVILGKSGRFYNVVSPNLDMATLLRTEGKMPLPPYIHREKASMSEHERDFEHYQSVFAEAQHEGAIAAPTASLHFTQELLNNLATRGVQLIKIVLHVGIGTFLPIAREHAGDVRQHVMHEEYYEIPEQSVQQIQTARHEGRRIIAVGTTSLRALEAFASSGKTCGYTNLYIYPGYRFKYTDGLFTNFHIPHSTLMLLVAAFGGMKQMKLAYRHAVEHAYRFFSYGDAMLIGTFS